MLCAYGSAVVVDGIRIVELTVTVHHPRVGPAHTQELPRNDDDQHQHCEREEAGVIDSSDTPVVRLQLDSDQQAQPHADAKPEQRVHVSAERSPQIRLEDSA